MLSKNFLVFLTMTINVMALIDNRIITTLKYSKHRVKPTIVNGDPAQPGEVPYIVSLKEPGLNSGVSNIRWSNLCGGSIIHKFKVLTAAHCFETRNFYYAKRPRLLRIVAGNLSTTIYSPGRTGNEMDTQWRQIAKMILHREFHFPVNDLAIIYVDKQWDFNKNVMSINPARQGINYPTICFSAGFGRTGHGMASRQSTILRLAIINVMSKYHCSRIWEINMDNFVCTDSARTDVGEGDSGGPLVCQVLKKPKDTSRYVLAGVVSGKNFDLTTLFTRVSAYKDWLDNENVAFHLESDAFLFINLLFINYVYVAFYGM